MGPNRQRSTAQFGPVLIWLSAMGSLLVTAASAFSQRSKPFWAGDLPAYLVGWRLAATPGPLYDLDAQRLMAGKVLQRTGSVPACPFNYPPHLAALGKILPPLTYSGVLVGWILGVAAITFMLSVTWAKASRYPLHIGAALIVGSPAAAKAVMTGSILPFAAIGALAGIAGINRVDRTKKDGQTWFAISVLGWFAVATKPHLAIVLGLACLLIRPARTVKVLAVSSLAIVGMPTLVFGPRIWSEWLTFLGQFSRSTESDLMCRVPRTSPNIEGLLTRAGVTPSLTLIWGCYVVGIMLLLVWIRRTQPSLAMACTVGAAMVPLIAPHANPQDLLLCLPLLMLPATGSKRVRTGWAIIMSLALLAGIDLFVPEVQIGVLAVAVYLVFRSDRATTMSTHIS